MASMATIETPTSTSHAGRATAVTVLGLGAMGRALATALMADGHPVTVWNRTPARTAALAGQGAIPADSVNDAVAASPLVVACLLDHASVHAVLDPVVDGLGGRALINVTTTTPAQARELAAWASDNGIAYLDGALMAVPEMIGRPEAAIFYSGDAAVFEEHRAPLGAWGESTWFGVDAGLASLWDLAILSGMYLLLAGFLHGAAMVAPAGVSATDFAARATPFLAAMTGGFAGMADVVDRGDYTVEGRQSLDFSDLGDIVQASVDQGVSTELIEPVQRMIRRQIAAGHGDEAFERIYEEIRGTAA
jgi:3-hydroxyisobutyrate dehydrogenase-like beta-hydroxyacid dehydrogenase